MLRLPKICIGKGTLLINRLCRKNFVKAHERPELDSIKQRLRKVETRTLPGIAHRLY